MKNTPTENKQVRLNDLSDDQIAIVTAERKVNAAKRRREETERQIQRLNDDAALFGKPAASDERRLLEHQLQEDTELVHECGIALHHAQCEPERRAKQEKRGAEVKRDMKILEQRISAAMESIAPLMLEADSLIQQVIDEFTTIKAGFHIIEPPFKDDESRTVLERLRFWARTTAERGDTETFGERLARYRRIGDTAKSLQKPATFTGGYQRSTPLPRRARENAAARLKMTPSGVETSR